MKHSMFLFIFHVLLFSFSPCLAMINASESDEETQEYSQLIKKGPSLNTIQMVEDKEKEGALQEHKKTAILSLPSSWSITHEEVEEAFSKSPHLVCILELGGYIKRINQNWTRVLGWKEEELFSKPYYDFIHPEDLQKTIEYEKSLNPVGFTNRFVCKSNVSTWFSWMRFSAVKEAKSSHAFCVLTDVTADYLLKEEYEKKLNILNEHLQIQSEVIKSVTELQRLYLGDIGRYSENKDTFFQKIIQHFVKLSTSEFGFIGVILNDEGKRSAPHKTWEVNPLLNVENQKLFDRCREEKEGFAYLTKLLNKVIETERPFLLNESDRSFESTDTSEQSLEFKSFLGVPLMSKNELVGIVALVNRARGYNQQLLEWFDPLFGFASHIINETNLIYFQEKAQKEKQARQTAEAKEDAKSKFLALVSHELRTPLSGMLGLLELINKEELSNENAEYLHLARESGDSLLRIINDLLDLSKIEAGKLELEKVPFSPFKVAQEVIQFLNISAEKKGLCLKLSIDPSIPELLIGDPIRIRQILTNIIGNAIKFTEKGSISIQVEGQYDAEGKNKHKYTLRGTITDTGIGISPATQVRIFKPFSQADETITRRFGGSGLGLTITKNLCEMMGGNIHILKTGTEGSTFQFNIVMGLPENIDREALVKKSPILGKIPPLHILIAEDNTVNQVVLQKLLEKSGCTVRMVSNGLEALEAIKKDTYDLVLMDGAMPGMDGFEATKQIRQHYNRDQLPIIGVTAHAFERETKRFLEAGINGYVTKPVKRETLFAEILHCLKKRKR